MGKLKKVLSVPKSLKNEAGGRRRSLSNLFKSRSRKSSITEDEIEENQNLRSSMPFLTNAKKVGQSDRERSKSENQHGILHPHQYAGINKISRIVYDRYLNFD